MILNIDADPHGEDAMCHPNCSLPVMITSNDYNHPHDSPRLARLVFHSSI
jgi:hypothetical protein